MTVRDFDVRFRGQNGHGAMAKVCKMTRRGRLPELLVPDCGTQSLAKGSESHIGFAGPPP
jgi:hypothetical protein